MSRIKFLHSVSIPPALPFSDPNLKFLSEIVKNWEDNGKQKADLGFVGVPFDGGVASHRRGARLGPKYVREALYNSTDYCCDHDTEFSKLKIVDFGDVEVDHANYRETHNRVRDVFEQLYGLGSIIIAIGGDHSLASPMIKGACKNLLQGQKMGVIQLDSHHDTRSGWGENSGLWAREILEIDRSPIRGENLVQIGIHGYRYSKFYHDQIKKYGITVYTPSDVRKVGIKDVMNDALKRAAEGTDAIYMSVDIDVLDQAYAPGTNSIYPGGLLPHEVLEAVYETARHPLTIGMDLVEVSPPWDLNAMTSKMGAEILLYFVCGFANRASKSHLPA
jgi:formimidoylglutamase